MQTIIKSYKIHSRNIHSKIELRLSIKYQLYTSLTRARHTHGLSPHHIRKKFKKFISNFKFLEYIQDTEDEKKNQKINNIFNKIEKYENDGTILITRIK